MAGRNTTEREIAGRYRLDQPIGRGGMGVVWRAEDRLLQRPVAVKQVELPAVLDDAERELLRRRVLREARVAARLTHPGAVTVYDVIEEDGHAFIVMELVDAPTLADVVAQRGPLPPDAVAGLALQVLDTL